MKIIKNIIGLSCLVLLALPLSAQSAGGCKLDIGGSAPDLAGADMNGRSVDLSQYRGKWVYVDFWASWCGPCMREVPEVVELNRELGGRNDFAVLSVSLDNESTLEALMNEIERHQIDYPVVYDAAADSESNADRWCIKTIPATFLIAPDGTLVDDDVSVHQVREIVGSSNNFGGGGGQGDAPRFIPGGMHNAPEQPEAPRQVEFRPTPAEQSGGSNAPRRISASGVLLDDSPSTGQPMYRDLEIALPIMKQQPAESRYQLIVATVEQGPEGAPIQRGAKYNLEISVNFDDPLRPYLVQIENTTDPKLKQKGELGSLPNMSFVIDRRASLYKFVVPIPGDSIKYAYKVSLLNEDYANYVDNSTIIVDVEQ